MDGKTRSAIHLASPRSVKLAGGRRDRLRQKLLERARREVQQPAVDLRAKELARLQTRQTELRAQRETIEYRMARERDDNLYASLARQYQVAQAELASNEANARPRTAGATW